MITKTRQKARPLAISRWSVQRKLVLAFWLVSVIPTMIAAELARAGKTPGEIEQAVLDAVAHEQPLWVSCPRAGLLAGKEASLVEFFYTFNALLDESKQIILTSDRYPKELTELDPRLVSRFSWGLSVGVEPPDIETRIEILLKKAESNDVELPRNCALFIAQQVVANVRELEGALNKVVAISRFKGTPIDLDVVRESLKDVLAIRARTISTENIQRVVSEYFRIPLKELVGPKRTRIYARPRQLAMGLARELTGDSFPEIGMAFGGRDHSTVMHACEKVQSLREEDPIFNEDYKNLLRLLQS